MTTGKLLTSLSLSAFTYKLEIITASKDIVRINFMYVRPSLGSHASFHV